MNASSITLTELTDKHRVVCSVINKDRVSFEIFKNVPTREKIKTDMGTIYAGFTDIYGYLLMSSNCENKKWYGLNETPESRAFMNDLIDAGFIQKAEIVDIQPTVSEE